ncbi:hypothetical protein WJX73_009736 [Symbiochloris irregularis]|uniref:Photosystem II 10 kDa polypeptide, chloroplastic n=1 Tax=Symbiochloris irregularis TaxID=706552 RepID=A0AAW1PZ87_9CHLO
MIAAATAQKSFMGTTLAVAPKATRSVLSTKIVASGGKKVDVKNSGTASIVNDVVRNNIQGISRKMEKKGWLDSQGRKGKGYGVYRFAKKYGANVDGYSPIYTPDAWSQNGGNYSLGVKGLLAWGALVTSLLGVGVFLIVSTSQL